MSATDAAAHKLAEHPPGSKAWTAMLSAIEDPTQRGIVEDKARNLLQANGGGRPASGRELPPIEAYDEGKPTAKAKQRKQEHMEQSAGPRKLRGRDLSELTPHLDTDDIIKGLLAAQILASVVGPPSCGKSFFADDIVMHVSAGIPWRGHKVRRGLVIVAALEGGDLIDNRFIAWLNEHPDVPNTVPVRLMSEPINLRSMDDRFALVQFIREAEADYGERCALILVDTLSRAMAGGDENSSQDMTALIAGADYLRTETGATVLLIHHSGKDETKGGRGHSSLFGAIDTEITISGSEQHRVATVTKQRDGIAGQAFGFTLRRVVLGVDDDGDERTSCVVDPLEGRPAPRAKELPGVAKIAMAALDECLDKASIPAPPKLDMAMNVRVVDLKAWRDVFASRYGKDDKKPDAVTKAFQRAKEALLTRELICISDPYVWRT